MYNIVMYIIHLAIRIASLFQEKVATLRKGQKATFSILDEKIEEGAAYIWFHAASLKDFEQGRPLLEEIRKRYPEYKILQTFFSPSGHEVYKDYNGADIVCYLPVDTPRNARRFVEKVKPAMAFFIKTEFWKNYIEVLYKQRIPIYNVSSIFRENQIFFRPYARSYAKVLSYFTHIFVQNAPSKELLNAHGITQVTVAGNTRFDRVLDVCRTVQPRPLIEAFRDKEFTFIAGSSWEADERLYLPHLNEMPEVKLIIAPRIIDEENLSRITAQVKGKVVRYSQATEENVRDAKCLLIDSYGLLPSLYRYADLAYIGGGFGEGVHNIAEAAVYGIPVLFGPNHARFKEAVELIACGGGFSIHIEEDFDFIFHRLHDSPEALAHAGHQAGTYVATHAGAVQRIMKIVFPT